MNSVLKAIITEIDPRHDLDHVDFQNHYVDSLADAWKAQRHNLKSIFLNMAKPAVRGLAEGAFAGAALAAVVNPSQMELATVAYAAGGAAVEISVYALRAYNKYLDAQPPMVL